MSNLLFSSREILVVIMLIATLIIPFKLFNKKNKLSFGHPLLFYSIIMLYYTVMAPIFLVISNQTTNRGLDFREQLILGWLGALLSSIFVLIGYNFTSLKKKSYSIICDLKYESLWSIGLVLNCIGIGLFMLSIGFDLGALNPFSNKSLAIDFLKYKGGFKSYFIDGQSFLNSGILLMFASSYSTKKNMRATFVSIIISSSLFLNQGFRFRVFFLFLQ